MAEIPKFTKGQNLGATHLNQLVGHANRNQELRGDGLVQVGKHANGHTVGLNVPGVIARIPRMQIQWAMTVQYSGEADEVAWKEVVQLNAEVDTRAWVRLQEIGWFNYFTDAHNGSIDSMDGEDVRTNGNAISVGDEFYGYVFYPASKHPNIRAGWLVPFVRTFDGEHEIALLVNNYADDRIGTVKMTVGGIPFGWAYMDGNNGTEDANSRYPRATNAVGFQQNAVPPLGWKTTIDDHAAHAHNIAPPPGNLAPNYGTGSNVDPVPGLPIVTDPFAAMAHDTDVIEPPSFWIRFMQRVK